MSELSSIEASSWLSHPMVSQMLVSGGLWALGDVIAQVLEKLSTKTMSSLSCKLWDPFRTARLAFFASCCWAPCTYIWFAYLERTLPGTDSLTALKRMMADQLLYAPIVIFTLFVVIGVLEGLSFAEIKLKVRAGYATTLLRNYMLWPVAQFILQGFVPLEYRIIGANLINVPWTAYLASISSQRPNTHTKLIDPDHPVEDVELQKMEIK